VASQNLVVCTKHVIKLVHGIDEMFDLAYTKKIWLRGGGYVEDRRDLPSVIIFAMSLNDSVVISTLITLLGRWFLSV